VTDELDQFDKQMAEIDKAMANAAPPAAQARPGDAPTRRVAPARPPSGSRREVISLWVRLVLVILLGVGLTVWPYDKGCGLGLAAYLAAVAVTLGTGAMTAVSTWRWRLGLPHVLSLGVTLGALAMLAHEVALRSGYAAASATWWCP